MSIYPTRNIHPKVSSRDLQRGLIKDLFGPQPVKSETGLEDRWGFYENQS